MAALRVAVFQYRGTPYDARDRRWPRHSPRARGGGILERPCLTASASTTPSRMRRARRRWSRPRRPRSRCGKARGWRARTISRRPRCSLTTAAPPAAPAGACRRWRRGPRGDSPPEALFRAFNDSTSPAFHHAYGKGFGTLHTLVCEPASRTMLIGIGGDAPLTRVDVAGWARGDPLPVTHLEGSLREPQRASSG